MLRSRKQIRLKKYDYSRSGYYHITICVQNRRCLFGNIFNGKMLLNDVGKMIDQSWTNLQKRFNVKLDTYQIMPNHIHGIIIIVGAGFMPAPNGFTSIPNGFMPAPPIGFPTNNTNGTTTMIGATTRAAPTNNPTNNPTIGDIVGAFKSLTTHEYINGVKKHGWLPFNKRLWQRNFYEHIIRNETELTRTRQYIKFNPLFWDNDVNYLK